MKYRKSSYVASIKPQTIRCWYSQLLFFFLTTIILDTLGNHLCTCYWVPLVCLLSFESTFFSIFRSKIYRSPFPTVAPSVTSCITTTRPSWRKRTFRTRQLNSNNNRMEETWTTHPTSTTATPLRPSPTRSASTMRSRTSSWSSTRLVSVSFLDQNIILYTNCAIRRSLYSSI